MRNILTIDLEDWHHGIEESRASWARYESRLDRSVDLLLEILSITGTKATTKATFFVLSETDLITLGMVPFT
jgi:hypothetical protein